jgi:transposase
MRDLLWEAMLQPKDLLTGLLRFDAAVTPWRPGGAAMADLFWLTNAQIQRSTSCFPLSRGVPRRDDQRVVSGIIHIICNGLGWRGAPAECGQHKTLYIRSVRWSRMGIFNRIVAGLVGRKEQLGQLMIGATRLKAHRTAACLLRKGLFPPPYRALPDVA